jgi:hypothetical protein
MSYTSSYQTNLANAKIALAKKNKSTDYRGLNTKKNYSSFWMDDKWDTASKFGGISTRGSQSSDLVKSVKLANYRRAVTNFVKIVTKKDIPVLFHGTDSHTDGTSITLSTDIKDSNFDVTVGLALHESSHIVLTNFALLKDLYVGKCDVVEEVATKHSVGSANLSKSETREYIKQMLNWVEDRRIDNYVFSTSPGYKAYYHKLYDYYWNSKDVLKGFISKDFRNATKYDSYEFHVINMINPNFNPNVLPGLDKIAALVDLANINRLQSTEQALEVAAMIVDIILTEVTSPANAQKQQAKQSASQSTNQSTDTTDQPMNQPTNQQDSKEGGEEEENDDSQELTPSEQSAVEKAVRKQRDFLNGSLGKKSATRALQSQLDKVAKQDINIQSVGGDDGVNNQSALMYDYTNAAKVGDFLRHSEEKEAISDAMKTMAYGSAEKLELQNRLREIGKVTSALGDHFGYDDTMSVSAVKKGLDMGALLGKKLQMHNEVRERVDNRLRSGKVDNRRLAHAGYGIESVFSQISIDAYKKANLHISLDGSGSMSGSKWYATIQMAAAIAKAVSYTQNIDLQVSVRVTTSSGGRGDVATNLMMYDSRKNKLNHLTSLLPKIHPNSLTPEGLCFEAMMKQNLLVMGDTTKDSYFLNISDGQPGMSGYEGHKAIRHTAKQVSSMKNKYNISLMSFWIEGGHSSQSSYEELVQQFSTRSYGRDFRTMYGKDASVVDCNSALMIARELNKKFLTK